MLGRAVGVDVRLELTCRGIGRAVGELDVLVGECIVVGLATFICLVNYRIYNKYIIYI